MVGLSIIHFSVLSFLFFLKVYIWPLFSFVFENVWVWYIRRMKTTLFTPMWVIFHFSFLFECIWPLFSFSFLRTYEFAGLKKKQGKEKPGVTRLIRRVDPATRLTRSKPSCKPVDFCFLPKWSRFDLQNSKSCATPCLPYHHLLKDDGKPYSRPQQYRSIVGALQYLTFTRPDIAFSVN